MTNDNNAALVERDTDLADPYCGHTAGQVECEKATLHAEITRLRAQAKKDAENINLKADCIEQMINQLAEADETEARLRAEVERMDKAIEQAAKWFDDYARQHRAKANACVTGDFDEQMAREAKVATNMDRADYLRQALQEKPDA